MKIIRFVKSRFLSVLMFVKFYKYYINDTFVHPFSSLGEHTTIGKGTNINGKCFISGTKCAPVYIGKYCAIAHNLRIRNRNHNVAYPNIQDKFQNRYGFNDLTVLKGAVVIGNACWIGDNVSILPGVKIGNGAVIGAGSIVTKDIPDYAIAAGNPARVIKYRFKESIIEEISEIEWWNWTDEKIKMNEVFFNTDMSNYSDVIKDLII